MSKSFFLNLFKKVNKNRIELIIAIGYLLYLIFLRLITPIFSDLLTMKGISPEDMFYNDWDFYFLMAKDFSSIWKGKVIAPFCFRPLMPLLAGILPFELQINFALITFIALYFTGILIYFTLRIYFSKSYSFMGLILFCYLDCSRMMIRYHFIHIHLIDSLTFFFLMCCFYTIFNSNKRLYLISLILGVLTKEVVLFTIPVFLAFIFLSNKKQEKHYNFREIFNRFGKNLIYVLPSLIVFILIRLLIKAPSMIDFHLWNELYLGYEYYSIANFYNMIMNHLFYYIQVRNLFPELISWGIIPLGLAVFNKLRTFFNWIIIFGTFMSLTYLQLFFSYGIEVNGSSRVTFIGFFPIILLSVYGLKTICRLHIILYELKNKYSIYIPPLVANLLNHCRKLSPLNKFLTLIKRRYFSSIPKVNTNHTNIFLKN